MTCRAEPTPERRSFEQHDRLVHEEAQRRAHRHRANTDSSPDELCALYADWADTYDRDHRAVGFDGHRAAAEPQARFVTRPDAARVLDAGAGTGAVGAELAALGFQNLVAVAEEFGRRLDFRPRQGMFADVLHELPLGEPKRVFFFGTSIGNLESLLATVAYLRSLEERLGAEDRLVVGMDLHKDERILDGAYNQEVECRTFFVHMLRRINAVLGADFDPRVFELASTYEPEAPFEGLRTHCVHLRIRPTVAQRTWVQRLELEVDLQPEQAVQVGISRKFAPAELGRLAELAGMRLHHQWFDERRWFSLNELGVVRG